MSNLIRTYIQDERMLAPNEKIRGARHWSIIEICSPTWFIVESCIASTACINQWMATTILNAVELKRSLPPSLWSRIYICMQIPGNTWVDRLFEEIHSAYVIDESESQVFELANGLSFAINADGTNDKSTGPKQMRLIYSRKIAR